MAAGYLEKRLRASHLKPAFGQSYRQRFPVKVGISLGRGNRCERIARWRPPRPSWTPRAGRRSGSRAAARSTESSCSRGTASNLPPSDIRNSPVSTSRTRSRSSSATSPRRRTRGPRSTAGGRADGPRFATRRSRLGSEVRRRSCSSRGDAGRRSEQDPGAPKRRSRSPAGIPVIQVRTAIAQEWLRSRGIDLAAWQRAVDGDLVPRSLGSIGVRLSGSVNAPAKFVDAENVAGVLRGKGALADEAIVIGAHYDHLGYGGHGSMKPMPRRSTMARTTTRRHRRGGPRAPGASSRLCGDPRITARSCSRSSPRKRGGLRGPSYFVDHPTRAHRRTSRPWSTSDMVGRVRGDSLSAPALTPAGGVARFFSMTPRVRWPGLHVVGGG
jgi:hypothetical protein